MLLMVALHLGSEHQRCDRDSFGVRRCQYSARKYANHELFILTRQQGCGQVVSQAFCHPNRWASRMRFDIPPIFIEAYARVVPQRASKDCFHQSLVKYGIRFGQINRQL